MMNEAAGLEKMAAGRVVVNTFVPGHPRTKGSLDVVNASRPGKVVLSDSALSKKWRSLIAYTVSHDIATRTRVRNAPPSAAPIGLRLVFFLASPARMAEGLDVAVVEPVHDKVGDLDKLVRNVMDALTDAWAYCDDVQVTQLSASKVYVLAGERTGVAIRAWERTVGEIRSQRAMLYDELRAYGLQP